MFRYKKNIAKKVVVWSLALLLIFNTNVSFIEAAQVSKSQTKETLSSIQPPSKVAAAPDTEPDTWTTVAKSVYQDVYEAPDPQMEALGDKIVGLDQSQSDSNLSLFSASSEEEEEGPPTNDSYAEPVSQLGEQGIYELLQQGAEPIDIYWIEYLMRLTGKSGDLLWQEHQQNYTKWKDIEKKYASAPASVTTDVYSTIQGHTQQMLNVRSEKLDSIYQETFATSKLKGSNSSQQAQSLSASLSSALNDNDYTQKISDLGKQEYAEQTGDTENISSSTGSLSWNATQIHLPGRDGLDLNVGIHYDSSNTSPYTRKSSAKRTASLQKNSYIYERNDLGMGWSFQIPSIEVGNQPTYHTGTGQSYAFVWEEYIKKESGVAILVNSSIPIEQQFSNGELKATIIAKHSDGLREYFSDKGLLLGKVDRYGNTLTYHYQKRNVNQDPNFSWGNFVIASITDTLGRKVTFDYQTTLNQGDEFQGEDITVTVFTPQGQPQQKVVYTKSRVKLIQNGQDQGYVPLLQRITNTLQESKTFEYNQLQAQLRFKGSDPYISEPYFLLSKVTSPRSATYYTYEQVERLAGKNGDSKEFRILSRYDVLLNDNNSTGSIFKKVDYTYEGDYTKYRLNTGTGVIDPELYRYSQTAHIKSDTTANDKAITNTYNGKHQLISTKTHTGQGEDIVVNYQAFDQVYIYNPIKIQTILQDNNGTTTRYKDIVYADWGGTQSETDDLVTDDYNNADTKARHTVTYTYDPTYHQVTSKTWYQNGGAALTEKYVYTSNGRLQSFTNVLGETTTYSYDASPANPNQIQRMTQQKSIRSGVTSSVTTTYGADYSYAYPTEQTSTFTNADQTKRTVRQTMTYDSGTGLLTSQTDSDGNTTTTTYDALGRPIKVTQPSMTNLDGTVYAIEDQYAYTNRVYSTGADSTNAGILTLRVDSIRQYTNKATGAVTVLSRQAAYYDGFGFLRVMETYNDTNGWTRSQYHPDDLGRAVYAIDPMGNTQTAAYDAWDQQAAFTDAQGNLYITAYHLNENKVNSFMIAAADVSAYNANTDNRNIRLNTIEQTFDNYGHKIKVVAFKDGSASRNEPIQESYTYDLAGNVLTYTDPNGNQNSKGVTTAYTYDALNRLTNVQDALDQTSSYTYDGGGGLSSVIISNPSGKSETLYTKNYNEQGLLNTKADTTGNQTKMNYNARGLTEQITDRNGTTTAYTYDERGQRTGAYLKADGSNPLITGTLQTKSIYGAGGNILTDRHELYINDAKVATQTSTIDKWDRITSLSASAADYTARLDASYDPLDRVTSQTNTLNATSLTINYGYEKSRLTQIQTNGAQNKTDATDSNVRYAYTPSGEVQQITFPTLSDGTTLQENMSYDPLNRLSRINNTKGDTMLSVYSYQYDNNGNITSTIEQIKEGAPQTSTYTYDKLNRLTGVKRADGTETAYSYDLRGDRLTQKDTRDLSDEKATNYRYDLDDHLIRVGNDGASTTMQYLPDGLRYQKSQGGTTTRYGYDHWNRVTSDQKDSGAASQYIRGDRVLVKKDLTNQKDYYYLYNGHGDVVQMVGTDGSLVNSYQYDEWGNVIQQKETVSNEFKYAGELYDAETGLYYLKARYYDPKIGRFLNEDSYEGQINNPLSMNVYTYVHNNPLVYTDPSGHSVDPEPSEESNIGGSPTGSNYSGSRGANGNSGGTGRSSTASNQSTKSQSEKKKVTQDVIRASDSATNASELQKEQLENRKFNDEAVKTNEQVESLWKPTEKANDLWSKGKLKEHYEKHKDDFGAKSAKEYSDMAYEFGIKESSSIVQVKEGAFIYRYEPSTRTVFVGTDIGGRIKTFYTWDGRLDDEVISVLKKRGIIE